MTDDTKRDDTRHAAREALVFWGIGALVVLLLLAAHTATAVLLLTFGGVLFGTALRGAGEWIARHLHIRAGWGVLIWIGVFIGLLALAGWIVEPRLANEVPQLWTALVRGIENLRPELASSKIGERLLDELGKGVEYLEHQVGLAVEVVKGVTGVIAAVVYVAFVAIYYAFSPGTYRRGVLLLIPRRHRPRASVVLAELGTTLQRWVWARAVTMVALGIASAVGLWLLGIPLAMTLGLLAGGLLFVPYLGSLISSVPALLTAAAISPLHVVYVALLYIGIHAADGYVLDPLLQKHAVRIPPVLLLASQLVIGALWGVVGFTFATPLVGAIVTGTRLIYVEDILHAPDLDASPSE